MEDNTPKSSGQKSRRKIWIAAGVGLLIVAALALWFGRAVRPPETPVLVSVAVAKVTRADLARTVTFDAEFRPYQEIEVHAKVAGFVKTMDVDIGDHVHAGQTLATLEVPELQDQIQRAQAAYNEAHLAYTRLANVNKSQPNLIAQQELDDARAKDQVTKADLNDLQAMSEYTEITAPFAGVITDRYADLGALIPGGTTSSQTLPLVRLSENDRLRLTFPVSVSYVSGIHVGQPVEIHLQSTGETLPGKISRFTDKVDTTTRTMNVEVDVPNPKLTIVPGVYASVAVELDRHDHTLAVPVAAVARKETATVYVVTPQDKIEERTVTLGLETPALIEILHGLKENDLVLIGSRTQVQPGQTVLPKVIEVAEAVQ